MPVCFDPSGQESSDSKPPDVEAKAFREDDLGYAQPPHDQPLLDLTIHVKHMRHELLKQTGLLEELINKHRSGHAHQVSEAMAPVAHTVEAATAALTSVFEQQAFTSDLEERKGKDDLNDAGFSHEVVSKFKKVSTLAIKSGPSATTMLSDIDEAGGLRGPQRSDDSEVFDNGIKQWRDVARHRYFRSAVMVAVSANAFALGLSIELVGPTWDRVWYVIGHIFTALFALEMFIKFSCYGIRGYFCGREAMWNILDFVCAWIGILGSWVAPLITGSEDEKGATVFRLLRVVRLAKLVHANKNLAVLAEGMIASLKSLIWVAVLLVVVLYAFAVGLIMSGIGEDVSFGSHWNPQYFGTLFRAMVSLFGVCIGAEWTSIIWPVIDDGKPGTMLVFVAFIFIAQFGFLNIIVGVIVDRTNAATQRQKDEETQAEIQQKMSVVKELGAKMHMYDESESGGLTFEEFTKLLLAPENQELRSIVKRDLPIGFRARDLHSILEDDVDGNLTRKEFEEGIERLISATPFQERLLNQHRQAVMINEIKSQSQSLRMEVRSLMAEIKGKIGREALPRAIIDATLEI